MFVFLNRKDLYWVSDGFSRESFESDNDQINACDAAFGIMKWALSPSLRQLSKSIKDPQELWTRLERTFGMINDDHNSTLESTSSTISILDPKTSFSTLSDKVVQDEEEAEASTQPIGIEDSLHAVTPSSDALEVHEISDI